MNLSVDLIIVLLFLILIFIVGLFERKKINLDDYWVNSRKTNKFVLIATVTSTFIGVGALISNAGVAFSGGGLMTLFLMSSFFFYFLIFAWFFAPKIKEFGDKYHAYTLPDFLEHTYSKKVRIAGLLLNLLTYGFWLALQILGIGIFVSLLGGINPIAATAIGGAVIILYTSIGGLRADIRTDVFQFFIMLSIVLIFLPAVIIKNKGFSLISELPSSFLTGQEFAPLYVFVLGFLFLGASNFVSSDLWQRAYAADSKKNALWSMKVAGIIVFIFLIAGVLMGVYGKIVVPYADANTVVPELMKLYLPPLLFGFVMAGFFAAIMSSADTSLLVLSMTITHDLYQKTLGHKFTHEKILRISRWVTFIAGILALIIALFIFNVVHLAIDAVSFYVALLPAIIFGFYWKKATANAAFWSIILGTLTIITFLFISPVEAFIPGIIVSFISFLIVNYFENKKLKICF
ncbi:sodium:solute symporter family protein [Candidatus Woesearchaeota archaeon]|nr:sodium:solute symporter family protein [Candidatus Woesearchaeota archaeon]